MIDDDISGQNALSFKCSFKMEYVTMCSSGKTTHVLELDGFSLESIPLQGQ
jgi:hypothetical protein